MKYIIGGVAFSGNKGASGMLTALMQNIALQDKNAEFAVLSYYPKSDLRHAGNVRILDGSPKAVLLRFLPALWCGLARFLHLPECFWKHGVLREFAEADYFLDAAGISFVDGREKFTVFNILTILPALICQCKVIKAAQALGPFNNLSNRLMAQIILPRLTSIVARGRITAEYLSGMHLNNVEEFSDVAFSMQCTEADKNAAEECLKNISDRSKLIGISPSQVVFKLCQKAGVDYCGELEKTVRALAGLGYTLVLFPHSARQGVEKTHNNDLPLLKMFASRIRDLENVVIIERELEAGELRMLIKELKVLVASRFHAIISAMSVGVPSVVIGWSHKYSEVLEPFELDDYVMPYDRFDSCRVITMAEKLTAEHSAVSERILQVTEQIRLKNQSFFARFSSN